jgi:toxin ParE1/3/4
VKVALSPLAEADLMDVAAFIAEDNPTRALTFVDELEAKCDALGGAPGIGTSRPELGEGMRMLPHGRYLIFYREVNEGLRIERILHGARDIGSDDMQAGDSQGR